MITSGVIFLGLAAACILGLPFYHDYKSQRKVERLKEKLYRFPPETKAPR